MFRKKLYSKALVIITFAIVSMVGCSKPPTQEMARAEKAVDEAQEKEASIYVSDLYKKAGESLKIARNFVANKQYREAKRMAEETLRTAQQSIALVEINKAKMKIEVEQMLQNAQKEIDELKSLSEKATGRKGLIARTKVKDVMAKWEINKKSIKEKLQEQQIRKAYDEIKAVLDQMNNSKKAGKIMLPLMRQKTKLSLRQCRPHQSISLTENSAT